MSKTIKVTQIRSVHGRLQSHKDTARGLGLRRMHQTVELQDTPEIRGMVNRIAYLLKIEG